MSAIKSHTGMANISIDHAMDRSMIRFTINAAQFVGLVLKVSSGIFEKSSSVARAIK